MSRAQFTKCGCNTTLEVIVAFVPTGTFSHLSTELVIDSAGYADASDLVHLNDELSTQIR